MHKDLGNSQRLLGAPDIGTFDTGLLEWQREKGDHVNDSTLKRPELLMLNVASIKNMKFLEC